MKGPSVKMIEHLAFLIGERSPPLESEIKFEVTVQKLNPPLPTQIEYSEVTLVWPR